MPSLRSLTARAPALVFLRFLGFIYLCAFLSLLVQLSGLFGSAGISPIADYLRLLAKVSPENAYWQAPTLFWFASSDAVLNGACLVGCAFSLILFLGFIPRVSAAVLWALYLSFMNADYVFLQFQWDNLLVEAGFLAIFLAPRGARMSVVSPEPAAEAKLLFRWLLFRLMFCSGVVKLASGDPVWRSFDALSYHYLTQPLPHPGAYFAAKLPDWFQRFSVGAMFFIELFVPFLYFCRPALRRAGGYATILFQLLIILTGNYAFFNLLTIGLCVFLFEEETGERQQASWVLSTLFCLFVFIGTVQVAGCLAGSKSIPEDIRTAAASLQPLRLVNQYGLFAVMTTTRREIEIEGSLDGKTWESYRFRYKPGEIKDPPRFAAPHQPRLDWQLWFAALGRARDNPWFFQFLARLHEGSPEVVGLLENNPFPEAPPRYLRALLYEYEFTMLSEKKIDGTWWKRKLLGQYLPPVEFQAPS